MSDPGDGDPDPVEWLDGIEWSADRSADDGDAGNGVDDPGSGGGDGELGDGDAEAGVGQTTRQDAGGAAAADAHAPASPDRIRAALSEVRREVRKAALVHAAAEGALAAVVANLLLSLVTPAALAGTLPLPAVVFGALRRVPAVGAVAPRTVGVAPLVAAGVGGVGFAAAYLLRLRRPSVERFEAANPSLREALRTARDAVESGGGSDSEMARRLYADVIARLRAASTLELVDARRLTVTVVVVAVVAVAGVQVAVVDPDLGGVLAGGGDPGATVDRPDDDDLQDGDEILGDAEDVEAGDEIENVTLPGTGDGTEEGPTAPGGGTGGGGGAGEFDSQQAGFAGDERIEDAELVREYNLRIREFDDDGTETDDDTA
jgi:hypothetical protein